MSRRGTRSIKAEMRRFISRLLSKEAYRDLRRAESVNLLDRPDIAREVRTKFGTVDWALFEDILRGEVISDSRGQGSLQVMK